MGRGGGEKTSQRVAVEQQFKLGDVRVVDGRSCGHHINVSEEEPFGCVEVLDGPVREFEGMERLPHDYHTPDGLGMWRSIAVISVNALDRFAGSLQDFKGKVG